MIGTSGEFSSTMTLSTPRLTSAASRCSTVSTLTASRVRPVAWLMPPTCPTLAGTSRPPRSARRKRIPKSEGAGLRDSRHLVAGMKTNSGAGDWSTKCPLCVHLGFELWVGCLTLSKQDALADSSDHRLLTRCITLTLTRGQIPRQSTGSTASMWLNGHSVATTVVASLTHQDRPDWPRSSTATAVPAEAEDTGLSPSSDWRRSLPGCRSRSPRPPAAPPSGPRSIRWSAHRMTSRLCSMTTTVLPWSTSLLRTSSSFRVSSKCRPVVGSSRI